MHRLNQPGGHPRIIGAVRAGIVCPSLALGLALLFTAGVPDPAGAGDAPTGAAPASPAPLPRPAGASSAELALPGCLPAQDGYLRARLRGALSLDLAYSDRDLECDGEARPDGSGIRLSFAGPQRRDGRRLRLVFGIGHAREGRPGRALPTNLTVMVEGAHRLFSTRGEDQCSVDELSQQPLRQTSAAVRAYRVVGRGFCLAPANSLSGGEHLLVSEFDFAGLVRYGASERDNPPSGPGPPRRSGEALPRKGDLEKSAR